MNRCVIAARAAGAALVLAAAAISFQTHAKTPQRLVAARAQSSDAEVVTVAMTEYRFDPDRLSFNRGVKYVLRLDNKGKEIHDFSAPGFFKAVTLENPGVLGSYGTSIVVKPGEHADVTFVPVKPGTYPFVCADHDWAGMTGTIVIK